jgi:DNA repair exonuclease SbcCD nuclease subunit
MVAIFGDLHIKNDKIQWFEEYFVKCFETAEFSVVKTVVFLGDIFHDRSAVSLPCFECFERLMARLAKKGLRVIIVRGNHDLYSYDSYSSILDKAVKNAVNDSGFGDFIQPLVNVPKYVGIGGAVFINYTYHDTLKMLDTCLDGDVIFGHFATEDCLIAGEKFKDGVSRAYLKRFRKVFLGHIHDGQEYGNIHHLPSVYQSDFGESPNKYFIIVDEDFEEVYRLPIPTNSKKITVVVDKYLSRAEYDGLINSFTSSPEDAVRVHAKCTESDYKLMESYLPKNVKKAFAKDAASPDKTGKDIENSNIDRSFKGRFRDFCNGNGKLMALFEKYEKRITN